MEKSKRNINIDILRCILAFLVVAIHTLNLKTNARYIIIVARSAVPIFFILSGYFMYDVKIDNIKKRIKNTFILLIISNLFFAMWSIISNYNNLRYDFWDKTFNFKNIIKFTILNNSIYRGHLWFIGALLYCQILLYLEKRYFNKKIKYNIRIIITMILLIILVIFSEIINIKSIYYFRNFLFLGLPYYYIGILIKERYKKKLICKNYLGGLFILLVISLNFVEVLILKCMNRDYLLEHYISTIPLSIITVITIISLNNKQNNNVFSIIGQQYSLYIYLIHVIIIDIILKFEKIINIQINQYVFWILTFFISVIISFILKKFLKIVWDKFDKK